MERDVVRKEVLQRTLDQATSEASNSHSDLCVICLDHVHDLAVAIPCKHRNFDFICLTSWLKQRNVCPLCNSEVTSVEHKPRLRSADITHLHSNAVNERLYATFLEIHCSITLERLRPPQPPPIPVDRLARRRVIYRKQLYSLRVGTNRLSQYRELTPQIFRCDENMVSRARMWIRRELQVFAFLDPDSTEPQDRVLNLDEKTAPTRPRRARNSEFLLEYIIAILQTVDIKGSSGQAEELLQEYIGRDYACLFLHELQAWLRSPYQSLQDWDTAVQYAETPARFSSISRSRHRHSRRFGDRKLSSAARRGSERLQNSKNNLAHHGREIPRTNRFQRARRMYSPS